MRYKNTTRYAPDQGTPRDSDPWGRGAYLSRSEELMACWISGCDINGDPPSVSTIQRGIPTGGIITQLDRRLRLCLFAAGPRYLLNYYSDAASYRSIGYAYCAECFDRHVLATAILPSVKGSPDTIWARVVKKLAGESRDAPFSIPSNYRVVARILDDVIPDPSAASVRRNCMDYLFNNGEFRVVRHDRTYMVLMSLSGQPRRGASFRKYAETADCGNRDASERLRVVHTAPPSLAQRSGRRRVSAKAGRRR